MTVIVACDPGGIKPGPHSGTGYAVLDTEGMQIRGMHIANHNPYACAAYMYELAGLHHADHIVSEGFKPRWGQKFELDSVYLIGGMQAMFDDELKLVMPNVHMGLVPKARLTALMKSEGYAIREGHSRMALSVAVYWAGFKLRDIDALDFLKRED